MNKNSNNKKNNRNQNRNNQRRFSPTERALELLGVFQDTLCMGFSEETWSQATAILNEISMHVDLETRVQLGNLMTEAYTNPAIQNTILGCERIAMQLHSNQAR